MGVFPSTTCCSLPACCLPHARGGVSSKLQFCPLQFLSSPRTWGCFFLLYFIRGRGKVFPTHVGVFPHGTQKRHLRHCLPHARGGVSTRRCPHRTGYSVFPTHVGVFPHELVYGTVQNVFPTHVGVFLKLRGCMRRSTRLPHARGGVSATAAIQRLDCSSSPRTWGCFSNGGYGRLSASVFPTHVGYFKKSINYSILNKKHPYLCGVLFI